MDEILEPPADPVATTRLGAVIDELRRRATSEPWLAAAFLAGVLVGWVGLGWWLLPIQWRNASPAVLSTDWQTQYIQLVAASLARDPADMATTSALIAALERPPEELARLLAAAEARSMDANRAADVHALTVALGATTSATLTGGTSSTALGAPGAAASPTLAQPATGADSSSASASAGWQRDILWLAGLAVAGLMGLLLIRRLSPAPAAPGEATGALAALPAGSSMTVEGTTRGLALGRRRPANLHSRLDVGDSVTTECDLAERFYQTWLLYDEQGGLVGSAGVQDKPVGQVGTLVVWLRVQFDDDDRLVPPQLHIVSESAYRDPMLRERLSDENSQVIPAESGRVATLVAGQLALDVEVRGVRSSDNEEPRAVAVRMGLRRQGQSAATGVPLAEAEPPLRYREE